MLNEIADAIHLNAVSHGFWEREPEIGRLVSLMHCVLSEAVEEASAGHALGEIYHDCGKNGYSCKHNADKLSPCDGCLEAPPKGVALELCDSVIRILDAFAYADVDIDALIAEKMHYNATRPYKHGKEF